MMNPNRELERRTMDPFDAHAYTIVIRRVVRDGEAVFHGRVLELPDLEAYEPTHEEAYAFLVDAIETSRTIFTEKGKEFPRPLPQEAFNYSGRVTLRMPRWLHAQLDFLAQADGSSLNQFIVAALAGTIGSRAETPQFDPNRNLSEGNVSMGVNAPVGEQAASGMVRHMYRLGAETVGNVIVSNLEAFAPMTGSEGVFARIIGQHLQNFAIHQRPIRMVVVNPEREFGPWRSPAVARKGAERTPRKKAKVS